MTTAFRRWPVPYTWIGDWLGSAVTETLLETGFLSEVHVLRLADGRTVVVKARPWEDRLAGCAQVHRHLWRAGFPCPEPIAGPARLGEFALSAEPAVAPPAADPSGRPEGVAWAGAFAALLARLVRAAPDPREVPSLAPSPPWIRWHHRDGAIWPRPDDRDADLHSVPSWHDEAAIAVRERLGRFDAPPVVGHCDFEAHNVWWRGDEPVAVHDWDSAVSEPEAVVAGVAAAMWPAGEARIGATVEESAAFLEAYQRAAGRPWTPPEVEAAWAAGLWIRLFNAKKGVLDDRDWLARAEAEERARLAGL
ncbi:phosphotransferase [Dactylosporangium sp. CA-092794]|uniref:phosphotransferase n=1 Tax=Dactylosporangium sp. CA-092794 TaxID=3239929 RepID=UPI003D8B536C